MRILLLALAVAAGLGLAGCAGRGASPPVAGPGALPDEPWQLPTAALGTQRLYRVSYDGPEGDGSFKLSLRLLAAARYQVVAVDPLGRSLWTLDVTGDDGLWIDHRARAACRLDGELEVLAERLTPFPLAALPALLLGRLPARPGGAVAGFAPHPPAPAATESAAEPATEPAAEPAAEGTDGSALGRRLAFRDAAGRSWTATLGPAGLVQSWSLADDGGTPTVFWRRSGGDAYLSDRLRGVQLRWHETVAEPLGTGAGADRLPALAVPPGFATVDCATLYPPAG